MQRFGIVWKYGAHSATAAHCLRLSHSGVLQSPCASGRMRLFAFKPQLQRRAFTVAARPTVMAPYIQLMRADKPIGSLLLMWPGTSSGGTEGWRCRASMLVQAGGALRWLLLSANSRN